MKTNSLKSMILENRWRVVVVLFAFLSLISLATTLGLSQIKSQKRVTALQLGDAAEGARVTIVSDSALNDYEAFRRGDRFYVKIPVADFAAASPNFRGNGFEDVKVQKVGDSVIVSFKLQPGATARVDQRSNRLDVIFSTVGMASRNVPPVNAVKSYPTSRNRRNASDSEASAGPVPPGSTPSSGQSARRESANLSPVNTSSDFRETSRSSRSSRRSVTQSSNGQTAKGNLASGNQSSQSKTTFPTSTSSPTALPSPVSTPTASTAFATPAFSPAAVNTQQPVGIPVSSTSKTPQGTTWESRIKFVKAWAKLNRSALTVGGLIALALLTGLVLWSRRKGRGTPAAKTPGKDISKPTPEKVAGRPVVERNPVAPAPVSTRAVAKSPMPRKETWVPQPAPAGFAAAAIHEQRDADQDREVFEL